MVFKDHDSQRTKEFSNKKERNVKEDGATEKVSGDNHQDQKDKFTLLNTSLTYILNQI